MTKENMLFALYFIVIVVVMLRKIIMDTLVLSGVWLRVAVMLHSLSTQRYSRIRVENDVNGGLGIR